MERANERMRTEEGRKLWDRTTIPLRRPRHHETEESRSPVPDEAPTPEDAAGNTVAPVAEKDDTRT
jgi:membrane protein